MTSRVLRASITFIVFAYLVHIFASRASACTAVLLPGFEVAEKDADAVFTGKVVAFDDSPLTTIASVISDPGYKRVLFNVTGVWKGSVKSQVIVSMGNRICSDYRIKFHKEDEYLIYAKNDSLGNLEDSTSSLTRHIENAVDDLKSLGASRSPTESADLATLFYVDAYWPEVLLVILLILVLFWSRRGRRRKIGGRLTDTI